MYLDLFVNIMQEILKHVMESKSKSMMSLLLLQMKQVLQELSCQIKYINKLRIDLKLEIPFYFNFVLNARGMNLKQNLLSIIIILLLKQTAIVFWGWMFNKTNKQIFADIILSQGTFKLQCIPIPCIQVESNMVIYSTWNIGFSHHIDHQRIF